MSVRRALLCAGILTLCVSLLGTGTVLALGSRYGGKTDQGMKLRARVEGRRLYLVRVKVRLRCRDGGLLYDDLSDFEATPVDRRRRFADVQFGPSDEVRWRGRLSGRTISGTLRVRDKVASGARCDSGAVGFSASAEGH